MINHMGNIKMLLSEMRATEEEIMQFLAKQDGLDLENNFVRERLEHVVDGITLNFSEMETSFISGDLNSFSPREGDLGQLLGKYHDLSHRLQDEQKAMISQGDR